MIIVLFLVYRIYMNRRGSKAPSSTKRRTVNPLNGVKSLFITFVQLLQALLYFIVGRFTSVNKRKRYKKRGSASAMSQKNNRRTVTIDNDLRAGRTASKEYYTNTTNSKPKDVVFHDLNNRK